LKVVPLLLAVTLFLIIAGVGVLVGKKFWVEPKQAMDRVTNVAIVSSEPRHSSLVWYELVAKMGSIVPASPANASVMTKRLNKAGIRSPHALKTLYGAKAIQGVLLPAIAAFIMMDSETEEFTRYCSFWLRRRPGSSDPMKS